jgi:pyruvate dehydrogenase E1 component beta subunit
MLLESILGENPVIIIEHRSLFGIKENVPEIPYRVRLGSAAIRRQGADITLVAMGLMVNFAEEVSDQLIKHEIYAEVVDLRTISPIDTETIITSVTKTKRVCVLDPGWSSFGVSAEILAMIAEKCHLILEAAPIRIAYPDSHTPMSQALESEYYPDKSKVVAEILKIFKI